MSTKHLAPNALLTVALGDLSIHPLLTDAPRLAKKDPRYLGMKSSWEESGVIPPILVTPDLEIVDGRHRYWFAQDQNMETVTALVIDPNQVPSIILGAIGGRNHLSKAQMAYLAAPLLAAALEQCRERRLRVLKSGGKTKLPEIATPEELAERIGVNPEYLRQAAKIHEAFANETTWDFSNPPAEAAALLLDNPNDPEITAGGRKKRKLTFRAYFEPRILDAEHPLSLGDVLKGIGYFLSGAPEKTAGKAPTRNSHLHMFVAGFKNFAKTAIRWDKLSPEDKDAADLTVEKALKKMPAELLENLALRARKELQQRTKIETASDASPHAIAAD
jgi:hypothetical protein